jgi:hypothetical protein
MCYELSKSFISYIKDISDKNTVGSRQQQANSWIFSEWNNSWTRSSRFRHPSRQTRPCHWRNWRRMKHTRYVILALLILIPSIINLSTPLYNRKLPELFGMPFFYWFQTLWLVVCSGFYLTFAHLIKGKEEDTVNK